MGKGRAGKRLNQKGRTEGMTERSVIVRRSLLHSPQFSALSCAARALFFELQAMFNGQNNGKLFLSVRDATARLGFADCQAAMSAFAELEHLGFITEAISGCFAVKADEVSRARAWRLNWIGPDGRCVGPESIKSLDFMSMNAKQKRRVERRQKVLSRYLKDYQRGQFAVEETSTLSARMAAADPSSVQESATRSSEIGGNPRTGVVVESTTHVEYHPGAGNTLPMADVTQTNGVAS